MDKNEYLKKFEEALSKAWNYGKINYLEALMKCDKCGLQSIVIGKGSLVQKLSFGTLCAHCAFEIANMETQEYVQEES